MAGLVTTHRAALAASLSVGLLTSRRIVDANSLVPNWLPARSHNLAWTASAGLHLHARFSLLTPGTGHADQNESLLAGLAGLFVTP